MGIRLFRFFAYFMTLPAFIVIVRNETNLRFITWVFYVNILFQAILAFLQGINYIPHLWPDYWREMYGFHNAPVGTLSPHHKHISMVMLMGFSMTLGFMSIYRSFFIKGIFGAIAVLIIFIPLFAGTRTFILAFVGFFIGFIYIQKIRTIPIFAMIAVGYILFSINLSDDTEHLVYSRVNEQYEERVVEEIERGGVEQLAKARIIVYRSIAKAIIDHPQLLITGTGFQAISVFIRGTGAHNNYLQFLMETGIVGLVIFLLFLAKTSTNLLSANRTLKNKWGELAGYIWAGFIGLVFSMMVGETLYAQAAMFTLAGQIMVFIAIGITPLFWSDVNKRRIAKKNYLASQS